MHAAIYVRVSTDRQTVQNQLADLHRLVEARGYEPVVSEEVESAAKHRPVLDRLQADARAGRVRAVAVWALDRLHRSMVGAIQTGPGARPARGARDVRPGALAGHRQPRLAAGADASARAVDDGLHPGLARERAPVQDAERDRHLHARVPRHRGRPLAPERAGRPRARAPRSVVRPARGDSVDNGSEFTSHTVDAWAYERGIKLDFITPGKPTENGHIESFNGKFRDECLNENWFISLDDARRKFEVFRVDYNEVRPHSSLDNQTPNGFARSITGLTQLAV
ncbi:Integrase [Anaeromyxobacter dehalogenans 2CP-C]|uniref:Integrase n=1 Tax=Anaeromyxobacter dehalogenans (strain 2CP-C) TaxID=290397 RepID=Q2ILP8_ANADE|nr:Integrase [Anaeromyxobacter dehalogenans 2CP-C]